MHNQHTKLELAILEKFGPHFAPGAKLLYYRNGTTKASRIDEEAFAKLGISVSEKEKFSDVVMYDAKKKWLFLIEAVTAQDFISPRRRSELEKLFEESIVGKVYINAFWSFAAYTKHLDKLAWETEVWIAEMPSHLIHYNGDKFLSPK
jgi:BsuBI/PstI restriction endonuclease